MPQEPFMDALFTSSKEITTTERLNIYKIQKIVQYHKTSNISHTLVGNKIVDHSDVVGTFRLSAHSNRALPVCTAPITSSFSA